MGIVIIFLGFLIIFLGSLTGANRENTRFSVFGLVGFIPFGFANDKRLFAVSIFITIFFILVTAVMFFRKI